MPPAAAGVNISFDGLTHLTSRVSEWTHDLRSLSLNSGNQTGWARMLTTCSSFGRHRRDCYDKTDFPTKLRARPPTIRPHGTGSWLLASLVVSYGYTVVIIVRRCYGYTYFKCCESPPINIGVFVGGLRPTWRLNSLHHYHRDDYSVILLDFLTLFLPMRCCFFSISLLGS